jgi:hypothetical protein
MNLLEYEKFFPDQGTIHIHHCKEGVGNDRFYLTREEDGSILGFCHHCGQGGKIKTRSFVPPTGQKITKDVFKTFKIPQLSEWDENPAWEEPGFSDLSKEFRYWWLSNGLNVADVKGFGVKHLHGRLPAIPMRGTSGDLVGLAIRPLRDTMPKWIVAGSKYLAPISTHSTVCGKPVDKLVITEDIVSAMRCSKHAAALPLLGTNLSDKHIHFIVNHPSPVLIWLDNDSREVVLKARSMYNRVSGWKKCSIFLKAKEPKHFVYERELREAIKNG